MKTYNINKMGGEFMGKLSYDGMLRWLEFVNKNNQGKLIFVVSALNGITRLLDKIFQNMENGRKSDAKKLSEDLKMIHIQRIKNLLIKDPDFIFSDLHEINNVIEESSINENNPSISKSHLLKFGELISSKIFYNFLISQRIDITMTDARQIIIASGHDYCNSDINESESMGLTNNFANQPDCSLTQGYIARNLKNQDKLLGFDGSDMTAGFITKTVNVCNFEPSVYLTFWKNVSGVEVNGRIVREIGIKEYLSLPTTPARKDSIETNKRYTGTKILIKSFYELEDPGTKIIWK